MASRQKEKGGCDLLVQLGREEEEEVRLARIGKRTETSGSFDSEVS